MSVRGVRGAITVKSDTSEAIVSATKELLQAMILANNIRIEAIASAWLTTTSDLTAEYPAVAARQLGWVDVPLLCGHEMEVPHGLHRCVRVMLHWNTAKSQRDVQHIYLRGATVLRLDKVV